MNRKHEIKEELIAFLDRKAFDPILEALPEQYSTDRDRRMLADVQQKIANEKDRFHRELHTAHQIRETYLDDVHIESNDTISRELEDLELPRFRQLKPEFLKLCEELGI